MKINIENWEEDFDLLFVTPSQWFGQALISEGGNGREMNGKVIKNFIVSLLQAQREQIRGEIEGKKTSYTELDLLQLEGLPINERTLKEMVKVACAGRQDATIDLILSLPSLNNKDNE
jgi:hypothetical protein